MLTNQVLSWFQGTRQWTELAESSREIYALLIRQGLKELGTDKNVKMIGARDADALYLSLWENQSAHKANSVCAVLRRVWHVLERHGEATTNPFAKMDLSGTKPREVLWTHEQVEDFIAASYTHGMPSIGLLVNLCYTFAQRPGDMRRLRWSDYRSNAMHFVQQKTKKSMVLDVPPDVGHWLDEVPIVGPYIVTREDTLLPYTDDDYQPIFRAVRKLALLPLSLQIRDLRRTALSEAADGGATDSMLQALGGHDQRSTLNVYQVRSQSLSRNAMEARKRR